MRHGEHLWIINSFIVIHCSSSSFETSHRLFIQSPALPSVIMSSSQCCGEHFVDAFEGTVSVCWVSS